MTGRRSPTACSPATSRSLRCGLGARRPALAHADRGRHHRQLPAISAAPPSSTHCRRAISPPRRWSKTCRPGRIFSTASVFRICLAHYRRRAAVGRFRTAPATRRSITSCGRAIPRARAGASTRRAAACAPTRPCCSNRPDFFIHSGDNIYADCPIAAEAEAAGRRDLAQYRHRGKIEAGARRSPSFAATTNTICSTTICAPSMPRCRCSRNGTITR